MLNALSLERDLEAKRTEGLALLKSTAELAESENRAFTDDERAAIQKITADGQALQAKLARLKGDSALHTELERLAGPSGPRVPRRNLVSLGEQFVRSEAYDFFRKGGHRSQSAWRSPSAELELPAGGWGLRWNAATLTEDPASGGGLVVPDYQAGIQALPQRRPVVADLIAPGTTTSNVVVYMREKTFVNAANSVLEGAAKPESTLTFEAASDPVRKIAHWLPVSEEMLEDVAQIQSYIDARLRLGVVLEEEDQLLNGTTTPPDIVGIRNRTGLAAPVVRIDPVTNVDAILNQIMAIFNTAFLMPDGIVINPTNWTTILLSKTAQGVYLAGGPFTPLAAPTLWGLPVVPTPVCPAATAVVGAYMAASQVFRRGGMRVEASNSHQDFFVKNLVAIRAEERLALAVYRPGAFGQVTGLN